MRASLAFPAWLLVWLHVQLRQAAVAQDLSVFGGGSWQHGKPEGNSTRVPENGTDGGNERMDERERKRRGGVGQRKSQYSQHESK